MVSWKRLINASFGAPGIIAKSANVIEENQLHYWVSASRESTRKSHGRIQKAVESLT